MPLLGLAAEVRIELMMPAKRRHDGRQHEQADLGAVDVDAARPRRAGIAAGRLDPVAELGLRQHVAEDERGGDEPEQRHVDAERADIEVADQRPAPANGRRRSRCAAESRR